MNITQKIFLAINIIGGILVIGSYILGLRSGKGADVLWGGVPVNMRTIYTGSMLICAIGYFIFFAYIMVNLGTGGLKSSFWLGESLFLVLFLLILLPSSLWMPLTNVMANSPGTLVWIGIRAVLILVAIGSFGVFLALLTLNPRPTGLFYYSALVGIAWFTFHTAVLDAILWPYLWGKQ